MLWSPLRGTLLAAALATSAMAATAATGLQPLDEAEMSAVYGRGLGAPTLQALSGAAMQDPGSSYATAADVAPLLGTLSSDGLQSLDRQLGQQRIETATVGLQTTLKLAQTMSAVARLLAPVSLVPGLAGLGVLGGLGGLASLPTTDAHKH